MTQVAGLLCYGRVASEELPAQNARSWATASAEELDLMLGLIWGPL